jgi:polo-like kinase 1
MIDPSILIHERHLRSGKPNKDYSKGRFLGKGGFAKCYEFVEIETKKRFAAKVIPKSSLKKKRAKQKVTIFFYL